MEKVTSTPERLVAAVADRYTVERELGRGGMATVYLAHDVRHARRVALKVFRPEVAAAVGADRFLAEIRTTANLQHPNILPLFDSGSVTEGEGNGEQVLFYVMPYVEGESLRDRLDREGQLPVADAVRITSAVADALAYAHGRGVVHRDIKPENILLQDGRTLVADFGIALAAEQAGGGRLTETGLALGTPLYMSPEQAAGERRVDRRTDIYALGCVLYEMLAGEPPHTGATPQAIMARVLSEEPKPVRARRAMVPAHVEAAVHTALQRLPADRFQDAGRLAAALADTGFRLPGAAAGQRGTRTVRLALLAAGVAVLIAIAGWLRSPGVPGGPPPVARLTLQLPGDQVLAIAGGQAYPLDVSPDGTLLVYRAWSGSGTRLFVRPIDEFRAFPLPGTEGARQPFFSPDGEWVGFFADGKLQKVAIAGGAPIAIAAAAGDPFGAHWGPDGTILFSTLYGGLFRVSAAGGEAVRMDSVLVADRSRPAAGLQMAFANYGRPRWPRFLPDGKHALVTTDAGTYVLTLGTGEARYLFEGIQARYLATGNLMFAEGDERVRLVPFDLKRLEVTGEPRPALENVFRGPGSGAVHFAVSETGTLVYVGGGFERSLVHVDRDGRETPIAVDPRGYRFPRVSPDGSHVAVTVDPRPSDIWIIDLGRETATRFTTEGHNIGAGWSPDGSHLAFWHIDGQHMVRWPEGGPLRRIGARPAPLGQWSPSWAPGGRIFVDENRPETGSDLVVLRVEDGTEEDFLATRADEWMPRVSPDGRWVAYISNVSGADEVYVLPSEGSSAPQLVSVGGGTDPVWSRDGTELFYRRGNAILAVTITTAPTFTAGRPIELFTGRYDLTQAGNWDVQPDGRFVMVKADPATTRQFQVVLNWFEELRGPRR
jgi:eukaryotic-like serine/threonine-protein kinase